MITHISRVESWVWVGVLLNVIGPRRISEQRGFLKGNPRLASNDRSSVFKISICLSACLCVCSHNRGKSFSPRNLTFCHSTHWDVRKKKRFFEILMFGPLRALFRLFWSIFFFILCNSSVRVTSHTDGLTNFIFGTERFYEIIMQYFERSKKCPLRAL